MDEKLGQPRRIGELDWGVVDRFDDDLEREVAGFDSARHPAGTVGDDNYEPVRNAVTARRSSDRRREHAVAVAILNGIVGTTNGGPLITARWAVCSLRTNASHSDRWVPVPLPVSAPSAQGGRACDHAG